MSGIYIPMEMPTDCTECWFRKTARHEYLSDCQICPFTGETTPYTKRKDDCPLIPVPEHGRLIDADLFINVLKDKAKNPMNQETAPYSWSFAYECIADTAKLMPTIIPADPADKEGEG